jgi:hypothetical protein
MESCPEQKGRLMRRMEKIMSKTNDTERTRELEADRDELLDSGLDTVTGGGQLSLAYSNLVKAIGPAVSGV